MSENQKRCFGNHKTWRYVFKKYSDGMFDIEFAKDLIKYYKKNHMMILPKRWRIVIKGRGGFGRDSVVEVTV